MESSLLFFLVGLFIFATSLFVRKNRSSIQFMVFLGSGIIACGILSIITSSLLYPIVQISRIGMIVMGGLAGIVLWVAERGKLINRPGIQYFSTIILGLILTGLYYGLMFFYTTFVKTSYRIGKNKTPLFLAFLLIGFLIAFGYTFPQRWFIQRKSKEKTINN
ncbi:MAG: hypothetical protein DRP89_06280 [Candidatus Neomarinimicrobiota bacterium]|nr:MAG: hypothetical protein DRP89_06280 [Candidatus Neomarinimicrobiota bacterium]